MILYIEDLIAYISDPINRITLNQIPKRDFGLISNIAKQFKNNLLMTRGQSELLVKVLRENQLAFSNISNIDLILEDPKFKFGFRQIDNARKIFLLNIEGKKCIAVKFPFNNRINNILHSITNKCYFDKTHKAYLIPLTTKNLYRVINELKLHGFEDIDEDISVWYDQMKLIHQSPEEYFPTIDINGLNNINQYTVSYFNSQKKDDLLPDIFLARTLGISIGSSLKEELSRLNLNPITDLILTSIKNKINVSSNTNSISNVIGSITDVNAYPIMIILNDDQYVNKNLENWFIDLSNSGISPSEMSVLFRSTSNKEVNTFIKDSSLNNLVSETTKVVFIKQKVPKILFKIDFKPRVIISTSKLYAHFTAQKMVDTHPFVMYYTNQVVNLEDNHIV